MNPSRSRKIDRGRCRAPRPDQHVPGALLEVGPVGQPGDAVVEGQVGDLVAQGHLVADVARGDQQQVLAAHVPGGAPDSVGRQVPSEARTRQATMQAPGPGPRLLVRLIARSAAWMPGTSSGWM